jgi:hypothetical protein
VEQAKRALSAAPRAIVEVAGLAGGHDLEEVPTKIDRATKGDG